MFAIFLGVVSIILVLLFGMCIYHQCKSDTLIADDEEQSKEEEDHDSPKERYGQKKKYHIQNKPVPLEDEDSLESSVNVESLNNNRRNYYMDYQDMQEETYEDLDSTERSQN